MWPKEGQRKKTQDKGLATMAKSSIMTELMTVIAKRKTELDAGQSYVARLMTGGVPGSGPRSSRKPPRWLKPPASRCGRREHLVKEVADLVFHSMVLLGYKDLHWDDVESELARRSGTSGLAEKAARQPRGE